MYVYSSNLKYKLVYTFRGLEHDQEGPFREWFAHIGEMRSLCIGVPLLALTAAASPTHRRQIMKNLCFRDHYCVILDSPDRPNIKLNVLKVKNNVDFENVFHWLTTVLVEKENIYRDEWTQDP